MDENVQYESKLRDSIEFLLKYKYADFTEVVRELGSVDVKLARKLFDEIKSNNQSIESARKNFETKLINARALTSQFIYNLPAPNSIQSQWWFTINSIEKIAFEIKKLAGNEAVAFIGAPTVAYFYKSCFQSGNSIVKAYDIDIDIINCLQSEYVDSKAFDVMSDGFNVNERNSFKVVFIDPPWYEKHMNQFLDQACNLVYNEGFVFCVLPSQLTRPNILSERNNFIHKLFENKMLLLSIESDYFEYAIPFFEQKVFCNTNEEINKPWRRGDLLTTQVIDKQFVEINKINEDKIHSFYLPGQRHLFRIFIKKNQEKKAQSDLIEIVENFSNEISSRRSSHEEVHMWTSDQCGFSIKNYSLMLEILQCWQANKTMNEIREELKSYANIENDLEKINGILLLWKNNSSKYRKTPEEIERSIYFNELAIKQSKRRKIQVNDGFRMEFQRDRDRIIWSESFRRLANKCQVFSFEEDELCAVRTRLTHSVEVMQLATTIGNSYGLNRDLIEAAALCHDIGHTPFGHGGEYALNQILNGININFGGFNHYEHGLDIVEYLESPYMSIASGGIHGLNLMNETLECIIKHTFSKSKEKLCQDYVITNSKHKEILNNSYGSLESQTIRIADKISYFLSDIEDGIKMGVINYSDLIKCRLFNKAPIDLLILKKENVADTLYNRFTSQRRSILKVIMEDILTSSDSRLSKLGTLEDIKNAESYTIDFSSDIKQCLNEIWLNLQSGLLHKDSKVKASNYRAAQIIGSLFYLYMFSPELIDQEYRNNHVRLQDSPYICHYESLLGKEIGIAIKKLSQFNLNLIIDTKMKVEGDNYKLSTYNVILAKDYVASLTDQGALKNYHKYFGFTN